MLISGAYEKAGAGLDVLLSGAYVNAGTGVTVTVSVAATTKRVSDSAASEDVGELVG